MSSTLKIISAASDADVRTWRFTAKDSVIPRTDMSPICPFFMSKGEQLLIVLNLERLRIKHNLHLNPEV